MVSPIMLRISPQLFLLDCMETELTLNSTSRFTPYCQFWVAHLQPWIAACSAQCEIVIKQRWTVVAGWWKYWHGALKHFDTRSIIIPFFYLLEKYFPLELPWNSSQDSSHHGHSFVSRCGKASGSRSLGEAILSGIFPRQVEASRYPTIWPIHLCTGWFARGRWFHSCFVYPQMTLARRIQVGPYFVFNCFLVPPVFYSSPTSQQ